MTTPLHTQIDLNADVGESFYGNKVGNDLELIPLLTSANIACGFHGGDSLTLTSTIELALKHDVKIGAHPSFYDIENFGRKAVKLSNRELRSQLIYQIGGFLSLCDSIGARVSYLKPHGALYHFAHQDLDTAQTLLEVIKDRFPNLALLCLPNSKLSEWAIEKGIHCFAEGFADRAYQNDGHLLDRKKLGSIYHTPDEVINHLNRFLIEGKVKTIEGILLPCQIDSLCLHGDHPNAIIIAKAIRQFCDKQNIVVKSFTL